MIVFLIIVVVIVILLVIYFFLRHRSLSRNLYLRLTETEIKLYFSSPKNTDLAENLYRLDIEQVNLEKLPAEIVNAYQDLQTKQKELLKEFEELIAELFNLLDGHLLKTFDNNNGYFLYKIAKKINNPINFFEKDIEIMSEKVFRCSYKKINDTIQDNEDSVNFFKRVMISSFEFCSKDPYYDYDEHYFFPYHYVIYDSFVKPIMDDLLSFFADKEESSFYRRQDQQNYQKISNVLRKIRKFLNIE